jgi:hypothetical protein
MRLIQYFLLSPGLPFVIIAIGLAVCIGLFLLVKRDIRHNIEKPEGTAMGRTVGELSSAFEAIRSRLDEAAGQHAVAPGWSGQTSINLNRRGQVLRLWRRGDTTRQIATALSMRPGEVDMIIKVHRMVIGGAAGKTSEAV